MKFLYRCEDCERLKPEYAMAAELLRGSDPPITLAKVDCMEAGKKTCHKYSVSDYPILKIFSKTEFVGDYNGTKKARGIVKYMQVIKFCHFSKTLEKNHFGISLRLFNII